MLFHSWRPADILLPDLPWQAVHWSKLKDLRQTIGQMLANRASGTYYT